MQRPSFLRLLFGNVTEAGALFAMGYTFALAFLAFGWITEQHQICIQAALSLGSLLTGGLLRHLKAAPPKEVPDDA